MSLLAPPSAFIQIEDQIDAIGQKYRAQRILRGAMLWVAGLVVATFAAVLAAHFLGQGQWTVAVRMAWGAWALLSFLHWFVRPLLIRPKPVEIARFIEARVQGLHNGLTNGMLLARRQDLAESPWLAEIYNEIAQTASTTPLGEAVKLRDLMPLGVGLLCVVIPLVTIALIFQNSFSHGFSQFLNPQIDEPTKGLADSIEVQPKDVTVVAGQPLEITILARCPGSPKAKVTFEKSAGTDPAAVLPTPPELTATAVTDAAQQTGDRHFNLQYGLRIDHVDQPMRYRVDVAGTQSNWYTVTIVPTVKLEQLEFRIVPPAYTGGAIQMLTLKAADVGKAPFAVLQGSKVETTATVDVPVGGAMLELAPREHLQMESAGAGRRFSTTFHVLTNMQIAVLVTMAGNKTVARLPENSLDIACIDDEKPKIKMIDPEKDITLPTSAVELKIRASLQDDYGVVSARVLVEDPNPRPGAAGETTAASLIEVHKENFPPGTRSTEFTFTLPFKPEQRKAGNTMAVHLDVEDNRNLSGALVPRSAGGTRSGKDSDAAYEGHQISSASFNIKFEEPAAAAKNEKSKADSLRDDLIKMLKLQRGLHDTTRAARPDDRSIFLAVATGQGQLRADMAERAKGHFETSELLARKVLLKLSLDEATDAVDRATALQTEPSALARRKLDVKLRTSQSEIIDALEMLLASLAPHPATQPATKEGNDPLVSRAEALKKLDEALKEYMKKEQQILDQTTSLAKKPVDNWDDADKKKLEELKMAQEKLDAFMQEKLHDFSKNSEQDMANSSLLKQLMEVYAETTMAKDALKQKAAEIAVAAEENGIDNAKSLTSNIEKWLSNTPDRTKWTQEDPLGKTDLNMPELPRELEDIVGKLLEQQEDLFDEMEDANANWAGSFDKGIGWDAADGPIASMNAQGVTGNQLPNNNEMNGRSGEGRSGKSSGEFVEDHATGKGGRNTPTRLDPTPFQKGQVKDDSKDPTGGATGGGKTSGQGGEGLEGPVAPKQKMEMERLAQKQAQLRNQAERLNLQFQIGNYHNFKLDEAIAMMRRVESNIHANRYKNALRQRDVTLDALDTTRLMVNTQVKHDTTPISARKERDKKIFDTMKGELIPGWKDALTEYYRKLGQQ